MKISNSKHQLAQLLIEAGVTQFPYGANWAAQGGESMKPSWSDTPVWAMRLAQNEDWQWWWYESEPQVSLNMGYHYVDDGRSIEATYSHDWDDTLESRP